MLQKIMLFSVMFDFCIRDNSILGFFLQLYFHVIIIIIESMRMQDIVMLHKALLIIFLYWKN